ncbi:DUF4359 domain-containing protein [Nitrospirales bacterium NOB]|nr:MAG: hypothetical protein UZ03_NOB001000276 [Nitrospira sp. OLB3]MBV6469051.1 hypothetical protein [Nitrospirota bacterium]MCE7965981.1 DUF4359 domain-containing protein [Nitrospira sp. NTP2]MCK6493254.1 DUF4359 domain-containing protein [Nitrospira sp.]MDL1890446.1 DUF4359 domain-containing protein [Nitrospirales bacterium NOB]
MRTGTLAAVTASLAVAVGLAATNPTMEAYLRFIEVRLAAELDKMDQSAPRGDRDLIKQVVRAQGGKLIEGLVRPKTVRTNFGLLSLFETNVLDQSVLVLGVGGQFVPVHGVEEATLKVGRLAF